MTARKTYMDQIIRELAVAQTEIEYQCGAEKGSTKLNDTIQTVIGKKVYEEFPHLIFFILGRKQKKYTVTQDGQTLLVFDAEKDILDFGDIIKKCQTLELEDLKQAAEFLTGEISRGGTVGAGNAEKEEAYRRYLLSCTDSISIIGMAKKFPIKMAWMQLRLMDEEALEELKEKGTGRRFSAG